ncbi:hypothetical protein DFS33DRAFT_1376765 [Desarmillaria ectypa]|nr:hypothetical protein DFS33DRAFT_1376765 [Desarmillaria ectypa]
MSDEHTSSKITWFNSPLRSNQKVSTLVNMIQVGQRYGIHQKRATPARQSTSSGSEEVSQTVRLVDMIDSNDGDDMVVDVGIEDTPETLELDPDINLDASSEGSSHISLGNRNPGEVVAASPPLMRDDLSRHSPRILDFLSRATSAGYKVINVDCECSLPIPPTTSSIQAQSTDDYLASLVDNLVYPIVSIKTSSEHDIARELLTFLIELECFACMLLTAREDGGFFVLLYKADELSQPFPLDTTRLEADWLQGYSHAQNAAFGLHTT